MPMQACDNVGMTAARVSIQTQDFDLSTEIAALRAGDARVGAVCSFVGTVRDRNEGDAVSSMELEHYPGMTERSIEAIIDKVGLTDVKDLPASSLSYGQQRALEIGVTLSSEPELILLDEPTAGMTREETERAIKMIDQVTAGRTLIIIEHDMEVVFSLADTISVLHYGTILVSDTPEKIRNDQRVKDAYLGEG